MKKAFVKTIDTTDLNGVMEAAMKLGFIAEAQKRIEASGKRPAQYIVALYRTVPANYRPNVNVILEKDLQQK